MNRCNYSRKAPPPAGRHVNTWLDLLEGHMNESGMTKKQVHQCKHKLNEAKFASKASFSILRNWSTASQRMLGRFSREVPPQLNARFWIGRGEFTIIEYVIQIYKYINASNKAINHQSNISIYHDPWWLFHGHLNYDDYETKKSNFH